MRDKRIVFARGNKKQGLAMEMILDRFCKEETEVGFEIDLEQGEAKRLVEIIQRARDNSVASGKSEEEGYEAHRR